MWVEAELGALSGDEDASGDVEAGDMTDPAQAAAFVERTGVDALAVAIGNVHGFTPEPVRLDLERLAEIAAATPVPLVLHGASGLPAEDLLGAVELGVVKVNVNAELRRAYIEALRGADVGDDVRKLQGARDRGDGRRRGREDRAAGGAVVGFPDRGSPGHRRRPRGGAAAADLGRGPPLAAARPFRAARRDRRGPPQLDPDARDRAAVAAWLEGLGLQRARELVDLPENAALGMTQRVVLPIRHGDVLLGFLWVIVGDQPLTDADRAAIARGGAEVADNLGAACARPTSAGPASTRCWPRLLRGAGGRRPGRRPALAGDRGASPWPSRAAATRSPRRLRRRRGAADFAWLAQDDRVVILARDPAPSLGDELATAGARGGLSARFARLADIPDAIRQADVAAVCAKARPDEAAVAGLRPARQLGLIATLWMAAGRPLPPHPINELLMHRRGDQLLDALEGLLEHGGDVAAAAKALHLHRATLYRRIQRIEAITGLDFHRGEDRLSAHLALRLLRLYSATHQRVSR